MVNRKMMLLVSAVCILIIILTPYDSILGQYKTPEDAIKQSQLKAIKQIEISEKEIVVFSQEDNIIRYHFTKKKSLGWTGLYDKGSFATNYDGHFVLKILYLRKQTRIILVYDVTEHIITDDEGVEYQQFDFISNDRKFHAYTDVISKTNNINSESVYIDGISKKIGDLLPPRP
ncbi:MAG: hypothetical protein ACYCYI_05620 [Saccharofermentanales bacterium]